MSLQNQKLKLLYVLKILQEESDEQHPINAETLTQTLASYGIPAERKSIYEDIRALTDFGYDILHTRTPSSGYYLASRDFELPEVYLLTDAVQAAGFITVKKTRKLIQKLDGLLSRPQAKERAKGIYIDNGHKCDNEEIYYTIDTLSSAIANRHKVKLTYRVRCIGDDHRVSFTTNTRLLSPYAMVWQNDHYYLIANNEKYDDLMHLRLDRMKTVTETDQPYRPFSEVSPYRDTFDIADYTRKSFQMYSGEVLSVTLRCRDRLLEPIIDRFSDKIYLRHDQPGYFSFTVTVLDSEGFVNWLMQFGRDVEVMEPVSLRRRIAEKAADLAALYSG